MLFLRMIKGNLELWQWILLITVLLPMAIKDYRTKKINVYICLVSILAALVIRLKVMNDNDITLVIDLIPGMITLMLSYLFKDSIGRGDEICQGGGLPNS